MACWWRRSTPSPRPRERRRVSRGSPVGVPRREAAIEDALKNKLADRAAKRELEAARAAKEIEEFSNEFLNAARKCFDLIDVDCSGTLTKAEIVEAVQTNETVVSFLRTCGEPNLQFLLQPKRLERALKVLDTSNDGEVDVDECTASGVLLLIRSTRRPLGGVAARFSEHPVHSLMCAQGRRRSTAASRSACSRCPRSARARRAPRRPRTRSSAPSFCRWPARSSR